MLSVAVTHLNTSVRPALTVDQLAGALRAGSVDALADAPTAAALVTSLFVETDPRLIVLCAYEAGTDVDHANMLYLESVRHAMPRVDAWEKSVRFLLKETAGDDLAPPAKTGSWRELEQLALKMVQHAQQQSGKVFQPKLVGSTRLMLALNHRTVDGIDLIIQDPQ